MIRSDPKNLFHSWNGRLLGTSVAPRSKRWVKTSKKSSDPTAVDEFVADEKEDRTPGDRPPSTGPRGLLLHSASVDLPPTGPVERPLSHHPSALSAAEVTAADPSGGTRPHHRAIKQSARKRRSRPS